MLRSSLHWLLADRQSVKSSAKTKTKHEKVLSIFLVYQFGTVRETNSNLKQLILKKEIDDET